MSVRYSVRRTKQVSRHHVGGSSSSSTRTTTLQQQQQQQERKQRGGTIRIFVPDCSAGGTADNYNEESYDAKTTRKPKAKQFSRRGGWTFQIQRLLLKVLIKRDVIILASFSTWIFALVGMLARYFFFFYRGGTQRHYILHPPNHMFRSEDFSRFYAHVHPTTIRYLDPSETKNHIRPVHYSYPSTKKRHITEWTEKDRKGQFQLWDDEWYDSVSVRPSKPYEKMPECQPMHPWQNHQYPTCNVMHEQHLDDHHWGKFISHGYFRQTFKIYDMGTDEPIAMKTLRNERGFTPKLMERHRIDAMIYERTTASPWITDIYGYCGYSGLFEYAAGGTLMDLIQDIKKGRRPPLRRMEKLSLSIQAASGISDLHTNKDSIDGYSSMVHADFFLNQFVWSENRYKLNDFNRGHLMWWNEKRHELCPYLWLDDNAGDVSTFKFCDDNDDDGIGGHMWVLS
jgi:hypothetical protein